MDTKKVLSSMVVVLLTALSVSTMGYIKDKYYQTSDGYQEYSEDDYKYLGYIFDDYNKNINIGYKDEMQSNAGETEEQDTLTMYSEDERVIP